MGKTYKIRESELKEIIKEAILVECLQANLNEGNQGLWTGDTAPQLASLNQAGKDFINMFRGIPDAVFKSLKPEWRERIQNGDNDFLKWLLGNLGIQTTAGVAVNPDFVPNPSKSTALGGRGIRSSNADAHEVFYVNKAVDYLLAKAYPHYIKNKCGHCATYVREALNRAGLTAPWGSPALYAKNYINILPKNGWTRIEPSQAGQAGDIIVIDACRTIKPRRSHPFGHIAMCCGNGQWVSDFVQKTAYGLNGTPPVNAVYFFRYKNIAQ